MQHAVSLIENIRTQVSYAVSRRMVDVTRNKVEQSLWDVGWQQGMFIYLLQDHASGYIDHDLWELI